MNNERDRGKPAVKSVKGLHLPRPVQYLLATVGLAGVAWGLSSCGEAPKQVSATLTPTIPATETATSLPTARLLTATPSATATETSTITSTATATNTATVTPSKTATVAPTGTPEKTATPLPTLNPAEQLKQQLNLEVSQLKAGKVDFNNYDYVSSGNINIIIPQDGVNGFDSSQYNFLPGQKNSQVIKDAFSWAINNSPTLRKYLSSYSMIGVVAVTDPSFLSNPNYSGYFTNIWWIQINANMLIKNSSVGIKGAIIEILAHEEGRVVSAGVHFNGNIKSTWWDQVQVPIHNELYPLMSPDDKQGSDWLYQIDANLPF